MKHAQSLESHADRIEFTQALQTGEGESIRYSSTLLEKTIYYAVRLQDGTVLRISTGQATAGVLLVGMLQPVAAILVVVLILSGIIAGHLSKRVVEPLNQLDLEHPLENEAYEELSPLLRRLSNQHRQIDRQMTQLRRKTDEFNRITASMNEVLVFLDNGGTILSINPAAQRLFSAGSDTVGQDFNHRAQP